MHIANVTHASGDTRCTNQFKLDAHANLIVRYEVRLGIALADQTIGRHTLQRFSQGTYLLVAPADSFTAE